MTSLSSNLSALLAVLLLALARESQGQDGGSMVPDGLLGFVPEVCMDSLSTIVLPCAIENLCFALLPTDEEIAALPAQEDIQTCADVEADLCPITSRCIPCKELADDFFRCIILNNVNGTVSESVTSLVTDCSLDCSTTAEPVPAVLPETEAPVPAPTEAPAPDSTTPTDGPEESEATEAPMESGAVGVMVSTVAVVCGILSLITL
eukprot:CAMPEP_0116144000 /NCGR_PEP_ID=MMETSP0329-20121206/15751_1 /TAXON_ID=697910 /ORGANISM="Pseudo-nitzschia arenysensis, Strain B593" /LENGTH=205 /DNA_ID=CAMNT_0003639359 /DNA_START=68 /DNA_END=685 /DNA_ORIENTATION=-